MGNEGIWRETGGKNRGKWEKIGGKMGEKKPTSSLESQGKIGMRYSGS